MHDTPHPDDAPGKPGIPPRWTSSAKQGVGTGISPASRVWFTISHGILNEVYYPRIDMACLRDFGLVVTDGHEFFSEEKRHTCSTVHFIAPGAPAYRLTNRCLQERFTIEKEIFADPNRDVIVQRVRLRAAKQPTDDPDRKLRLYALVAPHLGNYGINNKAWVGDYKGIPMLFAERDGLCLAVACSAPWLRRSAGYVGVSDGWQDLSVHKQMTQIHERAESGNVALTAEIDWSANEDSFLLALGFGHSPNEAAHLAVATLEENYEDLQSRYITEWMQWQQKLLALDDRSMSSTNVYRVSTAIMRTHEAKNFPGGLIASLSIPWGFSKSDDDLGGYHLVWPRDLVESAGGLLACGAFEDACRVVRFLEATQEADGHWSQNMWLDGTPYWSGTQMDETALPILLVDLARREGALDRSHTAALWPMVRKAAGFLVRHGPVTPQDRWEEDPGYSPFTLAAEIAGLLAAADLADLAHEPATARYLRETADLWYANIDRWIYATGTELAQKAGVDGYYVRIAPPETSDDACASVLEGFVPIKNRPPGQSNAPAVNIISPDALALVRFGLRAADDPRIVNTVKVIDMLVKAELPEGPGWRRYNDDGYGEHEDGHPFDGTGVGRVWPLLTGERAHYELAGGRVETAQELLATYSRFADGTGLLPEQVWDTDDLPEHELIRGRPTGSAMPLVWAHAEYVKLLRSMRDGRVFDMPPQTVQRYVGRKHETPHATWRFNHKCRSIPKGKRLRMELLAPALIHWSLNGWQEVRDTEARDTGLGVYYADLATERLSPGDRVHFTFYWPEKDGWEGVDYVVEIADEPTIKPTKVAAEG